MAWICQERKQDGCVNTSMQSLAGSYPRGLLINGMGSCPPVQMKAGIEGLIDLSTFEA